MALKVFPAAAIGHLIHFPLSSLNKNIIGIPQHVYDYDYYDFVLSCVVFGGGLLLWLIKIRLLLNL